MRRITVVISQGQSAHPEKRRLEEQLVTELLGERGVEINVIPHLYDLSADSTGMLCLQGITGDMVVASWLFPRAAHWTLDRQGIRGHLGTTLLVSEESDEDEADQDETAEAADDKPRVGPRDLPNRTIYHLDLRGKSDASVFLAEIRRIVAEARVETVGLLGLGPMATPAQAKPVAAAAAETNGSAAPPAAPLRVDETPDRRWYPVIDYSRCTNCMECIDFCLFGVYGVDRVDTILVEQPDNCRKGCPACSRVCPENAIIFPQHKTPAIAGSNEANAGGLKIDLSALFGAPSAVELAALERDVELVAVGRDAVGLSVGIPKRQAGRESGPKDDLDKLMDQLDLDL